MNRDHMMGWTQPLVESWFGKVVNPPKPPEPPPRLTRHEQDLRCLEDKIRTFKFVDDLSKEVHIEPVPGEIAVFRFVKGDDASKFTRERINPQDLQPLQFDQDLTRIANEAYAAKLDEVKLESAVLASCKWQDYAHFSAPRSVDEWPDAFPPVQTSPLCEGPPPVSNRWYITLRKGSSPDQIDKFIRYWDGQEWSRSCFVAKSERTPSRRDHVHMNMYRSASPGFETLWSRLATEAEIYGA